MIPGWTCKCGNQLLPTRKALQTFWEDGEEDRPYVWVFICKQDFCHGFYEIPVGYFKNRKFEI